MKCSNCGMELDGNFCSSCGVPSHQKYTPKDYPPAPVGEYEGTLCTVLISESSITIRKKILFSKTVETVPFADLYDVSFQKGVLGGFICIRNIQNKFVPMATGGTNASDPFSAGFPASTGSETFYEIYVFLKKVSEINNFQKHESSPNTPNSEAALSFKQWKQERKNYTQSSKVKMCLNCGDKLLEKAVTCPTCGNKILFQLVDKEDTETINEIIYYAPNPKDELTPKWMKELAAPLFKSKKEKLEPQPVERIHKKSKRELKIQAHNSGQACCPKCGSISLSANKKGFGVIKGGLGAMAGGALTGGIGVVVGLGAGNINAKKVWVTCLNCGNRWKM